MRSPASARSILSTAAKASSRQTSCGNTASQQSPGKQDISGRVCSPAPANDQADTRRTASARTAVDQNAADQNAGLCRPTLGKSNRKSGPARGTIATPKGIAFSIAELLLVQAWAEANDVAMRIFLDHGSRAEEYEEAIAIQPHAGPIGRSLIWRNQTHVYVQPLLGRRRRYTSVSAAVESLAPESPVSVTDIVAKSWPKD